MKINGNAVKPGMIVEHKGELWVVNKSQSVKPGKGGAFNQVEMKNIKTSTKLNERFRASEEVERVRVDEEKYQYLYKQDNKLFFMNSTSYEQIEIDDQERYYLPRILSINIHQRPYAQLKRNLFMKFICIKDHTAQI